MLTASQDWDQGLQAKKTDPLGCSNWGAAVGTAQGNPSRGGHHTAFIQCLHSLHKAREVRITVKNTRNPIA